MSARSSIRWITPEAASAYYEVQSLAPALANLLYDPVMPEQPLHALLDWAEAAGDPNSMAAFDLPELRAVLPALVKAYVASHQYRLERGAACGRDTDRLVLDDTGNGAVVGRIMMLLTEVVAPLHGDEGADLGRASRSDLARHLFRIVELIETR